MSALPAEVRDVLQLRVDASQAAVAKFAAIDATALGGRLYDIFRLRGASRTGRWSGSQVQPHNLKRPTMKDPDGAAGLLVSNAELFDRLYGLEDLGSLVRSAIAAPDGRLLAVVDLANIESRVLGWMTGCLELNQVFAEGRDPYRAFGWVWMGIREDLLTKAQRNFCKPPSLGCGYGLGAVGLKAYAAAMGVTLTDEQCESAVKVFRTVYREVPAFWRSIESAFVLATVTGQPAQVGPFRVDKRDHFTRIRLPSGRWLWYAQAKVVDGTITYMGVHQKTRQWCELYTWGGKLCENVDQAIACDILAVGLTRAADAGLEIVGHVHDEIIVECDVDDATRQRDLLVSYMTDPLPWAPSMKLAAAGYVSKRYKKD